MKEVITYEAFDGTRFDDEYECYEYERLTLSGEFSGQIHFFDYSKQPLKISCNADEVYYAIVKTVEAAIWWNDSCSAEEVPQPFENREYKTGLYWYDDHTNEWKCLQEEMEKLQLMADEFQQFVE